MTPRQEVAYLNPCYRAYETLDERFTASHVTGHNSFLGSIVTVNR